MTKTIKRIVITLLVMVSLALAFGAGCTLGIDGSPDVASGLSVVEDAWDIIFQDYVDSEKLDADALSQGAINGMVEALDDPYTAYLDAETYREWSIGLEGKYEGIGAYLGIRDEQLIIIAPIAESPAAEAGIEPGDIILEIDGRPAQEMSPEVAASYVRGEKGTSVKLLIVHQGETEPEEIVIVRAEIEVDSVYFEMRGDIAYIYVGHFSERTNEEMTPVMESLTEEEASAIILDLRSNPGGIVDVAVGVTSRFLDEGIVAYLKDNQGQQTPLMVEPDDLTTNLPMVILTDNYTASASEILTGALQDYGRATVAGTVTFGKGSYTLLYRLRDGSGLNITAGRWLTPEGNLIEGEGITPDYELELEGEEAIEWAIDYLKGNGQ